MPFTNVHCHLMDTSQSMQDVEISVGMFSSKIFTKKMDIYF